MQPLSETLQAAWVHHAERTTLKRLRDEHRVFRRRQALHASDPANATHADGMQPLDDATWLASIGRVPGRSRGAVIETGCRILERAQAGRWSPVVFLGARLPEDLAESFAAAIDATRRVLSQEAARGLDPAAEARLRPSMRIARLFSTRPTGVPAWLGLLALLEEYVLTWDAPETMRRGRWDAIHSRDGWRCACAGCTKRASLEAHHVQYRSRGGGDTPTNVISVCGVHHRLGEHGTFASCRGQAPLDIVWGLGDPALRRWYRNEQHIGRVVQSPA